MTEANPPPVSSPVPAVVAAEHARRLLGTRVITLALTILGGLATIPTFVRAGFTGATWVMSITTVLFGFTYWLSRSRRALWAAPLAIAAMIVQHLAEVALTPAAMNSPTPYFTTLAIFFAVVTLGPRGVITTTVSVTLSVGPMLATRASQIGTPEAAAENSIPLLLCLLKGVIAIVQSIGASRSLKNQVRREAETEAARAEAKAHAERFQLIANHSDDLICLLTTDFDVVFASPSHERTLGIPVAEFMKMNPFDLGNPEDRPQLEAEAHAAFERSPTRGSVRVETRTRGERWFDVVFQRLDFEDRPHLVVSSRDVTETRLVADQLEEAKRLEALGRLSGAVAHDFNNLLLVVDAGAHLALRNLPNDSPARRDLEDIRSAAEKAARLTRQLLTFGRQKPVTREEADLGAVVRELEPLILKLVGAPIDVKLEVVDLPLPVGTDRTQIEQIVMNLVANAREAMPKGGTLTLKAAPMAEETTGVHAILLSVADSGEGIAPDVRQRMFEPFFTTKAGRGTGLGLSTVYGIVKQLDGRIEVESTVGAGTTFRVLLPNASAATPALTATPFA